MKKTLILTLAAGFACALTATADTYDLYITGATAFRQSVHDACKGLFDTTPTTGAGTLLYGISANGGDGSTGNKNPQWTMTGTCSNSTGGLAVSALGTNYLTIHALFNGSVQGIANVIQKTKLVFIKTDGNLVTNTPTIAFSDCASGSTIFDVANTSDWSEEPVAVQPFVWVRAQSGNPLMTNILNVTWEQGKYIISAGRMKLSAWTYKAADTNLIYILERTQDSGTRRNQLADNGYGYNQGLTIYNYDSVSNVYYLATNSGPANTVGTNGVSIIGPNGNGNANLTWGPGYVGGGDLRTAINYATNSNFSIGYLSFADAKTAGISNWSAVISFNGMYPTIGTNGSFFKSDLATPWLWGNTGTNDFSPITRGLYSPYGNEVLVYPTTDPATLSPDQNLTAVILGDQNTSGTILGIFDKKYTSAQTPVKGSIEYEIEASKPTGATALRLSDMKTSRPSVGGLITP